MNKWKKLASAFLALLLICISSFSVFASDLKHSESSVSGNSSIPSVENSTRESISTNQSLGMEERISAIEQWLSNSEADIQTLAERMDNLENYNMESLPLLQSMLKNTDISASAFVTILEYLQSVEREKAEQLELDAFALDEESLYKEEMKSLLTGISYTTYENLVSTRNLYEETVSGNGILLDTNDTLNANNEELLSNVNETLTVTNTYLTYFFVFILFFLIIIIAYIFGKFLWNNFMKHILRIRA